jgi:hypothetical protein
VHGIVLPVRVKGQGEEGGEKGKAENSYHECLKILTPVFTLPH